MGDTIMQSPTVARVVKNDLCSGCGLCAGVSGGAIQMAEVPLGYNRPEQHGPISAAQERIIALACPGSTVSPWRSDLPTDPCWGPVNGAWTGFSTDPDVRHKGSSGGALSAIAIYALRAKAVDGVVQVTPHPTDPMQNIIVVSKTEAEVLGRAGSRYAPSSPLESIDALLTSGRRYCFIGKPCDVGALRQLGLEDPRVAAAFPLVLSFFCGGIPSRRAARRLLDGMQVDPDQMVAFRYRGEGWPGTATASLADGTRREMSYHDSWGGYLSSDVQFRCKICPDAIGGCADIAGADAWYGASGYPEFDERPGRSLVVSRSERGRQLVDEMLRAQALELDAIEVTEIYGMQPSQARRKREVLSRFVALRLLGRSTPVARGLKLVEAARGAKLKAQLRSFTGLIYRVIRPRKP